MDVELSFTPVTDPETSVANCYPTMNGKMVYSNVPVMVDGPEIFPTDSPAIRKVKIDGGLVVKCQVIPPTPKHREPREDGLCCSVCALFNREVGVEEFEKVTHIYQNGEAQMQKEICAVMAVTHGKAMLTSKNVGYCPKHEELCADISPGCSDLVKKIKVPTEG